MIPKDSLPSPRSTIHDLLPIDVLSPQSRQRDILPSTRQTTHDEDIAPRFEVFERLDTVRHGFTEGFDGDARSRGGMNTDVVSNFIGSGEGQFGLRKERKAVLVITQRWRKVGIIRTMYVNTRLILLNSTLSRVLNISSASVGSLPGLVSWIQKKASSQPIVIDFYNPFKVWVSQKLVLGSGRIDVP